MTFHASPYLVPVPLQDGTIVYHYFVFSPHHFGPRPQLAAYTECLQTYGSYHNWMAMIDADEFIVLLPPATSRAEASRAVLSAGTPGTAASAMPPAVAADDAATDTSVVPSQRQLLKSKPKSRSAQSSSGASNHPTGNSPKRKSPSTTAQGSSGLSPSKAAPKMQHQALPQSSRTELSMLLDQTKGHGGLAMSWLMFGADGREERPPGGVLGSYLQCFAHNHVKVIVDPRMVLPIPVFNPHMYM